VSIQDHTTIVLRAECPHCGNAEGEVVHKNGQALVYCAYPQCGKYQYNAPKWELAGESRPDPEKWIEPGLAFQPHYFYVYRVWSKPTYKSVIRDGVGVPTYHEDLLYVGYTNNPKRRLREHAGMNGHILKPWAPSVGRVTFEMHTTEAQALLAEARAIQYEKPLYNIHFSTTAMWNCESSHCQVVTIEVPDNKWFDARRPIDILANESADEFGDPVVFRYLHFVWLAVDLPKVLPGSLSEAVENPWVLSVEGVKPAEFPVPEPIPEIFRISCERPKYAPDYVKRVQL